MMTDARAQNIGSRPIVLDGGRCVPRFSPNGKKIVFQSDRDGYKELYVMNADGSAQERLF